MGRKTSTVVTIDGQRYRMTPIDERHEEQAAQWARANMRVIATRVPNEVYAALQAVCRSEGRTVYEFLQTLVAQRLTSETTVQRNHAEWVRLRLAHGGRVAARRRKEGRKQTTS